MENWGLEIIKAVLSFFVAKGIELAYQVGKKLLKRGSLSLKSKRIELTKERYARIRSFNENPSLLAVHSIKLMSESVLRFVFVFIFVATAIFFGFTR